MRFDTKLRLLGYKNYTEYLLSPHWKKFKEEYHAAVQEPVCAVCGSKRIQLHHHNYARLGAEKVTDVTPLCRTHHNQVHDWLKANRGGCVSLTWMAVEALRLERGKETEKVSTEAAYSDGTAAARRDRCSFEYEGAEVVGNVTALIGGGRLLVFTRVRRTPMIVEARKCQRV